MRALRLTLALTVLTLATTTGRAEESPIIMIVHPARQADVSVEELAQIYLRRKRFWDDGSPIQPLNLAAGSAVRERFSRLVLRQSEARLADHWNRQYFYGVLPPVTLASTEAIRRYVASDPNAIGYVPASEADDSVRVVLELE
jgi:hypothetical protein